MICHINENSINFDIQNVTKSTGLLITKSEKAKNNFSFNRIDDQLIGLFAKLLVQEKIRNSEKRHVFSMGL